MAIREYLFVKELNPGQHEIDRKINHAREVNKKLSMEISEALQKVGDQKKDVVRDSFEEEIKEASLISSSKESLTTSFFWSPTF